MRGFAGFFLVVFCQIARWAACEGEILPDRTIHVPMRDGFELPTVLYLPPGEDPKNCPCILMRSPSGLDASSIKPYLPLSQLGYVIAVQATRNAIDPEGKILPYYFDGAGDLQDGYDAVEWLAASEWSNGKIGTAGASALGITQYLLAASNPPHLCCQYINVAAPSIYHHALFPAGQLLKSQAEGWLGLYAHDAGVISFVSSQHFYSPLWGKLNALEKVDQFHAPCVHYGGWYDIFLQGTIDAFVASQHQGGERGRGKHKLVIGPWIHFYPKTLQLGDYEVPEEGRTPPVDVSIARWFDHYLKENPNGVEDEPNVIYYVMGPFDGSPSSGNIWRTSDVWPIHAIPTHWFLTSEGTLEEMPQEERDAIEYTYDPENPIPTLGGANLFLEAGPKDQRPIEGREDILLFTSPELEEDMEVTGHIQATLHFASNQEDTDVVVRLCDVYPDGRSVLLTDAAYRLDVMQHPYWEKSEQGTKPLALQIDLGATSFVFAKGHKVRLSVSSSNYPRYEKNTNVGLGRQIKGESCIAKNTLFVGGEVASELILPLVRCGEQWIAKDHPKRAPDQA